MFEHIENLILFVVLLEPRLQLKLQWRKNSWLKLDLKPKKHTRAKKHIKR